MKVHVVWWDNGEMYDEHRRDIIAIMSTQELAEDVGQAYVKKENSKEWPNKVTFFVEQYELDEVHRSILPFLTQFAPREPEYVKLEAAP